VILVIAFGALVAAGIPLLLGLTSVAAALGVTALLSHLLHVDPVHQFGDPAHRARGGRRLLAFLPAARARGTSARPLAGIYDGEIEAAKAARVSLLEGSPESIDAGLDKTRGDTLSKVRAINGNVGAIGLADRDNGRVSMITLWDSGESMRASAQEADQLLQRTAEVSDQKIANVALYDVAMAQTVEAREPEFHLGLTRNGSGPFFDQRDPLHRRMTGVKRGLESSLSPPRPATSPPRLFCRRRDRPTEQLSPDAAYDPSVDPARR
jgi:hypothetical protein